VIDPREPDFSAHPAADFRRSYNFVPADLSSPPLVSVVTGYYDGGTTFVDTIRSVLRQSLQQWEWIIVNDGSNSELLRAQVRDFGAQDARFRVVENAENLGRSAARNQGVALARSEFIYLLDQDDLIEEVTLERCLFHLLAHPSCAFVNSWSIAFGGEELLWPRGFEEGEAFLTENLATGRAMIRKSVYESVGGQDDDFKEGFEDWDFWIRSASRGFWGYTIPEYLDWHRRVDPSLRAETSWDSPGRREEFQEFFRSRYPSLYGGPFPQIPAVTSTMSRWKDLACENLLSKVCNRALFILPWIDRTLSLEYEVAHALAESGWEVSVIVALPGDQGALVDFGNLTPDLHVVERFLGGQNIAHYARYLLSSRRSDLVILPNGEFSRAFLPYLNRCEVEAKVVLLWTSFAETFDAETEQHVDHHLVGSTEVQAALVAQGLPDEKISQLRFEKPSLKRWAASSLAEGDLRPTWNVPDDAGVVVAAGFHAESFRVLELVVCEAMRRGIKFCMAIPLPEALRGFFESIIARQTWGDRIFCVDDCAEISAGRLFTAADVVLVDESLSPAPTIVRAVLSCDRPVVSFGQQAFQTGVGDPGAGIGPLDLAGAEVARVVNYLEALLSNREPPEGDSLARSNAAIDHSDELTVSPLFEQILARPNLRSVDGASNEDAPGAEELASTVGEYIGFASQMRGGGPLEHGPFAQSFGHFDRVQAELLKPGAKLQAVSSQLRSAEASRLGLEEQKRYLSGLADERAKAIEDAADRYQELKGEAEGLRDERARLEESARDYLEKIDSGELRLAALEAEKNSLEEQRQQFSALADERASAIEDAADRYQELKEKAEGLRDERARLEEAARDYLETIDSGELRIAALETEKNSLEEQSQQLSALADERASATQDAASRCKQLEGEAKGLRDERARLEEAARGYLETIDSGEFRVAALETEKNSLEEQRQHLEDKILQLRELNWWKLASLRLFRRRWHSETDPSIGLHKNENSKD
jgi:predicted  nucleic acid-binding Zn-ribbon protein